MHFTERCQEHRSDCNPENEHALSQDGEFRVDAKVAFSLICDEASVAYEDNDGIKDQPSYDPPCGKKGQWYS